MHAVQPGQRVRILTCLRARTHRQTIQIAVSNDADPDSVTDEISELLSENGICNESSHILDWRYLTEYQPAVTASDEPEEGEVFGLLDCTLKINSKE
jgi:hypothetical protein